MKGWFGFIAALVTLGLAAGVSVGTEVESVACVSSAEFDGEAGADSPGAVLTNFAAALAAQAPGFATVGERERAALIVTATANAHIAERFPDHVVARTTDTNGNLTGECFLKTRDDGSWQLEELAVGMPEVVCEALANRE